MAERLWAVEAQEILAYFEMVNRTHPKQHWQNGIELSQRWLQLLSAGATQADIDQFVSRLESEPISGGGWHDLATRFRYWARLQGFSD
ncbi:MAG: hypothetical protein L0241_15965 [Planctomycetia bacterium]|nr:hypothetical protein [Planctomycetia bacterium]